MTSARSALRAGEFVQKLLGKFAQVQCNIACRIRRLITAWQGWILDSEWWV